MDFLITMAGIMATMALGILSWWGIKGTIESYREKRKHSALRDRRTHEYVGGDVYKKVMRTFVDEAEVIDYESKLGFHAMCCRARTKAGIEFDMEWSLGDNTLKIYMDGFQATVDIDKDTIRRWIQTLEEEKEAARKAKEYRELEENLRKLDELADQHKKK